MSRRLYLPSILLAALPAGPVAAQVKVGMSFWEQKESVQAMAFVPSGKTLVTTGGNLGTGCIAFWDLDKMTCSAVIDDCGMGDDLAMSADGKTLVVQTTRHFGGRLTSTAIHIYDVPSGKKRWDVKEESLSSQAFDVSHDSKLLALGNGDGGVSLRDLRTGKHVAKLPSGKGALWALTFSPDDRHLAAAGEAGRIRLWNIPKRIVVCSRKLGSETIGTLTFSPDGKTLVAGTATHWDQPGELILWDIAGNKEKGHWQGHKGPIIRVRFDRTGKFLASAARFSDNIILWDWATGKKLLELDGPMNLRALTFSPNGKILAAAGGTGDFILSSGGVRMWDMPAGRERLSPKAAAERERREGFLARTAKEQATARAVRDEKRPEANAERLRRAEYALKIHQARSHIERWEFVQARSLLEELRPAPGQTDLRGLEWHWLNAAMPRTLDLGNSEDTGSARISPDGKVLAVAGRKKVRLLDPSTGTTLFTMGGFRHRPSNLVFSPGGTLLAVVDYTANADQSDIKVFKVATGKLLATFTDHRDGVNCLAFAGDGSLLVAAGRSKLITIWDTKTWKLARSFKQEWIVGTAIPSPDLKLIASGTISLSLQVRELATGKELFKPRPEHRGLGSSALLFFPDGKKLIAESQRRMFVVETATGQIVRRIKSATGRFSTNRQVSLALTPDGRKLIAGWTLIDLAADEAIATFEQGEYGGSFPRREDYLHSVSVTSDERVHMVIAREKRVQLVSFPLALKPQVLSIGADHISHIGFSEDSKTLLASTDREIREESRNAIRIKGRTYFVEQWDAHTGAIRFRAQSTDSDDITLSFDKKKGATIKAGRAKLSLADLGASRADITLAGRKGSATVRGYSARAAILALQEGETLSFVDAKTGTPLSHLKAKSSDESFLCFGSEGQHAVFLDTGDVVLWNVRRGETLKRWAVPGNVYAVRMTADGEEPAAVVVQERKGERRHLLWNLRLGEAIGVLRGHGQIEAAAFAPDGQTLATIGNDGTVLLWDAVTGHARGVLGTNHNGFMTQLVFRPDGRGLAVGGYEGTIRLWTVP